MNERLQAIEKLLPYLHQLRNTGRISLGEDAQLLRQVYIDIYRPATMSIGCGSCVDQYLSNLEAYYTREKALYDAANQPQVILPEPEPEPEPVIEKPIGCKKCGKNKTK